MFLRLLPQVSTAVSGCQVLPVRTDTQNSDPGLPVGPGGLPPLSLQVLRVLPHIQNPQQVLKDKQEVTHDAVQTAVCLHTVVLLSHVAVEVSVRGGRVGVPQSDGVIRRAGEEGGRRQTGLRRI